MRHRLLLCMTGTAGAMLLAGCSLTPPEEDPVQVRLADLDARVAKIERIIANQSLVELSQRVDALAADARDLQGRIEVQENAAEAAKKRERDLYADLDRRLAALESGAPASTGMPGATGVDDPMGRTASASQPGSGTAPLSAAEQQRAYDTAFAALKDARYADAITGFRGLLERSPSGALAPNAQYWLGEAYYVTRDYESAVAAFGAVGERWPDSAKSPGAMLKLGYSQYELKRFSDAKRTFAQVVARYPDTEAAKLAQERMKRLIAEGH